VLVGHGLGIVGDVRRASSRGRREKTQQHDERPCRSAGPCIAEPTVAEEQPSHIPRPVKTVGDQHAAVRLSLDGRRLSEARGSRSIVRRATKGRHQQ